MTKIKGGIPWLILVAVVMLGSLWAVPSVLARLAAVGPLDPATGFPRWYQDTNGLSLTLCLDGPPNCLASAADLDPANPAATGEAFWWDAFAETPVGGGSASLTLAMEATYSTGNPVPGAEMSFGRIRVRADGLTPGATYTVTHPFASMTFVAGADTDKSIFYTEDIGCFPVPGVTACDFALAQRSNIGPFLVWDPAVAPAAPAGFVGDAATPHRVIGSVTGNNFFRVEGPEGTFTTDLFVIQGKRDAIGNRPPMATNDLAAVTANTAGNAINVLANDSDPDGNPLIVSAVTQPANGVVTIGPAGANVQYTPNPNFGGVDPFTYVVNDGFLTATARVTVTVNRLPVAADDTRAVAQNSANNPLNIMANDSDPDGNAISIASVVQPANGSAAVAAGAASIIYTPNTGFSGTDFFAYSISDGLLTASARVTVTVRPSADLAVGKTDESDPVAAGRILTYTITVMNAGPAPAESVVLTDTLPAGTTFQAVSAPLGWSCNTPPVGGNGAVVCASPGVQAVTAATLLLSVNVNAGATPGATLSNQAILSSQTPDPNQRNNLATTETSVASPPGSFPTTGVLDNFNRPDESLGSNWGGTHLTRLRILNNEADAISGGYLYWNPAAFGPSQEAYLTFTKVVPAASQHSLFLKFNGTYLYDPQSSSVSVIYFGSSNAIRVRTFAPGQGWVDRRWFPRVTLNSGDTLGARLLADGTLYVFKNGQIVGIDNVAAGPNPWPAGLVAGGGKIGAQFSAPSLAPPNDVKFDNFGGGTIP